MQNLNNFWYQFVWNITKIKQKEIFIETIDHDKVTETYAAETV